MVEEVYKGEKLEHTYLSLGSNLGDRARTIDLTIEKISEMAGNLISKSKIYETEPWGMKSKVWFLNIVIGIETSLSAKELIDKLLNIEIDMGRNRPASDTYLDRVIDIDILFHGKTIIDSKQLTIPHPKICDRLFVLKPLCDIAANLIHPVNGQSIKTLLNNCEDNTALILWK